MSIDVFTLRDVDYSEKGTQVGIIVAGRPRPQTVIYTVLDCQGEKCYYRGGTPLCSGFAAR